MPLNITPDFVQQLLEQIALLTKQNSDLVAQVSELTTKIAELQQTIKELEEKKNKNSKKQLQAPFIGWLCETACKPQGRVRQEAGRPGRA